MVKGKRALALVLTILFLVLIGCETKVEEPEIEPSPAIATAKFYNLLPLPTGPEESAMPLKLGLKEKIAKKYRQNEHSAGWLTMPNTTLDGVVMFAPEQTDPLYYLRRDFNGQELFEGTYFVDSRSYFSGGRDGLSQNTIVYGHSMSDDPNSAQFSQLKKLKNADWAKKNPYFYFSTLEEDMAWEVFAAFDTHVNFRYNEPNPTAQEFGAIVNGARKRSFYDYDVEIRSTDKIATLSTCIYQYNGMGLGYPNSYRYVVMGRLVPRGEKLKTTASLTPNQSITIDY